MRSYISLVCAFVFIAKTVHAASSDQWRGRSVYQIITDRFARTDLSTTAQCNSENSAYCGGSWQGIIKKLDYIKGMGFTAIYISPVTKNIEERTGYGEAYHGFWQQDIYSINGHFGTADDLRALSTELHNRDMYLMVDVIANHNAWPGPYNSIDWSQFKPFNQASNYHRYCPLQNYNNQTEVEQCYLGNDQVLLIDLRTEDTNVRSIYNDWIGSLVRNYSIDGIRIDTARHVEKSFFPGFGSASNVFQLGEVFNGDTQYACDYQNYMTSIMNYPTYFPLRRFLNTTSATSTDLVNSIDYTKRICKDATLLGSFSENHDNRRFPCDNSDMAMAKNLITYTILADGIPVIYSGQEHHYAGCEDPYNREAIWFSKYNTQSELYKLVASLNQVRNRAIAQSYNYLTYNNYVIYSDAQTVAMRKGYDGNQIITVITNRGASGGSFMLYVPNSGWVAGSQLMEILTCQTLTVDSNGYLPVPMAQGLPRIYYSVSQMSGSGICGK